jgi:hypothetical protein
MSLIVNPSASIDWSLLRERLCDKGLEKIGRLGAGETPAAEDRSLCLEALDSILKNLAVHGYKWPKTASTPFAASFAVGVQTATLPQDFYNLVSMNYIDTSGNEVYMFPITTREWNDIKNKTTSGGNPQKAYIDNFNVLHIWPVPSVATVINVYYEKVIPDSTPNSQVDLDAAWMLALPYGIGSEVGFEFEIDSKKLDRISAKWAFERNMLIQFEATNSVNQVSVDD